MGGHMFVRVSVVGGAVLALLGGVPSVCGADAAQVLVSLTKDHKVVLMSLDTGQVVATFPVVIGPHEITMTRDGARAYVANAGTGPGGKAGHTVSLLDLKTRRVTNFDLGAYEQPHDVRVSRDGSILWVACAPARVVLEMDARSGELRRSWKTGAEGGWFVAASPDDRKLYVPHLEGKRVVVIERARETVSTVYEGGALSGIDVSPDGDEVWVIDHERRTVVVVDASNDRVAATIKLPSADFGRVRISSDGRRAVVLQGKTLTIFDRSAHRVVSSVEMPIEGKVLDLSPSGARAVVSNADDNRVTVVDLDARKVIRTLPTGKEPDGVAWLH
jgi:YVTN family beta-propeller protein